MRRRERRADPGRTSLWMFATMSGLIVARRVCDHVCLIVARRLGSYVASSVKRKVAEVLSSVRGGLLGSFFIFPRAAACCGCCAVVGGVSLFPLVISTRFHWHCLGGGG
jgi:hypothetical protein